jgi:hypothetical protein
MVWLKSMAMSKTSAAISRSSNECSRDRET